MIERAALLAILPLMLVTSALADDTSSAELQKCKICHSLDNGGANRVGPNLFGVFGRKAGASTGFNYSDAMKQSGIVWDDETLTKFLRDPKNSLPGNRMSFPGITDDAVLKDLLQRLKQATQ
ncbi:MAG TPA: cytochrome c family protein [Stellaceae bacterium]|jgi:cytochrome c|nr:cytochrome c family protein [Stellaceae bacterium]